MRSAQRAGSRSGTSERALAGKPDRPGEPGAEPTEDQAGDEEPTMRVPPPRVAAATAQAAEPQAPGAGRPRYPPAPAEQLSFEDRATESE
jgi:hypothetical protein